MVPLLFEHGVKVRFHITSLSLQGKKFYTKPLRSSEWKWIGIRTFMFLIRKVDFSFSGIPHPRYCYFVWWNCFHWPVISAWDVLTKMSDNMWAKPGQHQFYNQLDWFISFRVTMSYFHIISDHPLWKNCWCNIKIVSFILKFYWLNFVKRLCKTFDINIWQDNWMFSSNKMKKRDRTKG